MRWYNAVEIWVIRVKALRVIAGTARGRRFETLVGYLYLTGADERLCALMRAALEQ